MITTKDIEKLKVVFATKNDLKGFATKDDLKRFATKKDLKTMENRIIETINYAVDFFDEKVIDHEIRIRKLEIRSVSY